MNITQEYYLNKFEQLKILSDTYKCKTILMRNMDTGELVVKKEAGKGAYQIYKDLKEINSNHIAKVLECFAVEDKCIAVEEYINGRSLESLIGEEGLSLKKTIDYALQICNGLMAIHSKGIIHRDIRPENIVISNEGNLKLIDFDIAREEKSDSQRDTELLGTAGYAPPEQYGFAQTDERSDIYSVGIVIREMAQGRGFTSNEIITKKAEVQNRQGATKVKAQNILDVIGKCIEIDPNNRFENVLQLKNALLNCKEENDSRPKLKKYDNILPPLTLKNIILSVPGFKAGNLAFILLSIFIHAMFLIILIQMGMEVPVYGWKKVYSVVMYILYVFIPYLYFANIGQIAQRFPKKEYKSKGQRIRYQILFGFIVFYVITFIIECTLPPLPNK